MRIRLDEDMNFTVREKDGKSVPYSLLFTVELDETGREYAVYTEEEVPVFRKEKVYASLCRREGEELILTPVETERELTLLWKTLEGVQADVRAELKAEEQASRRAFLEALKGKVPKLRLRRKKGEDLP